VNAILNRKTQFIDLGLIDYQKAFDHQLKLFNQILEVKNKNRNLAPDAQLPTDNFLLFCEHPHVYTLGRNGDIKNLKVDAAALAAMDASYFPIGRGGDITYHGPGQLVVYPVIDLENFFTDIHRYMRLLEESVIQVLSDRHIDSGRIAGLTGVWCGSENESTARKIAALGVKTSRWVTLHGMAFNVNTDLSYFDHIVPCGIADKGVTSLERETGTPQPMEQVSILLKEKIGSLFGMFLTTDLN
jgi:lipoyl(octanoyl) transferase